MRGDRPILLPIVKFIAQFTPHARGSTEITAVDNNRRFVYPACAGIDLARRVNFGIRGSLPRMRGDRPWPWLPSRAWRWFTPHARGSTSKMDEKSYCCEVYPACAGIDLSLYSSILKPPCLPRMRGDRPLRRELVHGQVKFTPHARGSTHQRSRVGNVCRVYPACAGIDPATASIVVPSIRLPRMRGDRPRLLALISHGQMFTPHARGSTCAVLVARSLAPVYPACAGIDRICLICWIPAVGLPRMRGDRPGTSSKTGPYP